jgi:hypothetical protein
MNSLKKLNSRYTQGGTTEVFVDRLGFWERELYPFDDSDEIIILESKYHQRPWLLANDKYRDVTLTWFVLQYNSILDINEEFVAGATIRLPTPFRLRTGILNKAIKYGI